MLGSVAGLLISYIVSFFFLWLTPTACNMYNAMDGVRCLEKEASETAPARSSAVVTLLVDSQSVYRRVAHLCFGTLVLIKPLVVLGVAANYLSS
jgi:hypothetical protein